VISSATAAVIAFQIGHNNTGRIANLSINLTGQLYRNTSQQLCSWIVFNHIGPDLNCTASKGIG